MRKISLLLAIVVLGSCTEEKVVRDKSTLFYQLLPSETGIKFANNLSFNPEFNIYTYRNFYNGGGVAIGDVNNDGLADIYFTSNQKENKLYLNKGNFTFDDITASAGVGGTKAWSTGVAMADVNGDGFLDIYVCNSGSLKGDDKENELFINNGNLTFTERAQEYGVADKGYTTHAAFFDYDKDNDLDLYILNNSYQAIGSFNLKKNERTKRDVLGGDKLLRNDNGKFTDVSEEAGIYGSVIGFGLGVTVGDVNNDNWPDIYVSNDFFERDYLYLNNTDGTFREVLTDQMKSISGASMGADLADINNDSYPDLFVTEMLPESYERLKTVTTFENWDRYQYNVSNDYFHQFTRNMLQLNNGNGTFSEIGRLAGVEATDWSWGALMFDMDNDGLRDLFVANGIYQDLTNQDYLQFVSNEEVIQSVVSGKSVDYEKLVELIPSNPVPNYAYRNLGNLTFKNMAQEWGLGNPGFSNGSAYGDLDNDGDLDLVVNNVNRIAGIYKNQSRELNPTNGYLGLKLTGLEKNTQAFGTKIYVTSDSLSIYQEQMPIRGFESSVDSRPLIGVGKADTLNVRIVWPDGKVTQLWKVLPNQYLEVSQASGIAEADAPTVSNQKWLEWSELLETRHTENSFVDFDRDPLTYHMISREAPKIGVGDLNKDGRNDFFIGGSKDTTGVLMVSQPNGAYKSIDTNFLLQDRVSEDLGSLFFDADNDGDLDLYVTSGGNEVPSSSTALIDRLYINQGNSKFKKSEQVLPTTRFISSSCVRGGDIDKDGDIDLFVGERCMPFAYGLPGSGFFLSNDGKGNFTEITTTLAPELANIGMITDAVLTDLDRDTDLDLVVTGEWMPVQVFLNEGGKFRLASKEWNTDQTEGWWNTLEVADVNKDGYPDILAGNHGKNSRFRTSSAEPIQMYINDFDQNGSIEQIMTRYQDGKIYPFPLKHDLTSRLPGLKKRYLKYEDFKSQTMVEIFGQQPLDQSRILSARTFESSLFLNTGKSFKRIALPQVAQLSTVYAFEVLDVNGDTFPDIIGGGNLYGVKPEAGRYDASYGFCLLGDGTGKFTSIASDVSGFQVDGEIRDIQPIEPGKSFLVSRNNQTAVIFRIVK